MLETICEVMLDAYKRNWITSRDGNVSIRHHDCDHFYITPSGEIPLHFGLQRAMGQHSNDVRVVVHVHPTYCIAAMHAGINLSTISDQFPELNRYTRVAHNVGDVPPISQELADKCHHHLELDDLGNIAYDIVGIKGHGVVAIDTSPWRAYEHIERLEHICKIVLCLLYTSPSPRDRQKSRMPSSA